MVDDEPKIRSLLRQFLEADGFEVVEAGNGPDGLRQAVAPDIDLVLLDVAMPGIDGLEVLRRLRTSSTVPVILVTARAGEVDQLIGLAVGADDYVTKPFSPRILVAKCKTVLRRAAPNNPIDGPLAGDGESVPDRGSADETTMRFEGFEIDPSRREVRVNEAPVELTARDFDLLVALASNVGRVLTRGQLITLVWGDDFFGDQRVVDVHIRTIRLALGDDALHPRLVQTVRAVGYRFLPRPL